ncbi:hypothetical protein BDN72DRAFT_890695 [Pluteus cervinus]|uniref:Uncharacterized protein n=1 Tax=Pluteus cervinus TaxID=181527 RepID=A0ACD3BG78_9AGAR|nr:hypothetical protein BDN72DRAFT_890695 [Pluteus cervinus]
MTTPPSSFPSSSSPSTSPLSQRRRSSAAHMRPAAPPPNLPIPSIPQQTAPPHQFIPSSDLQEDLQAHYAYSGPGQSRTSRLGPLARPGASPNLAAVAAFSQSRQVTSISENSQYGSTTSLEDLSDPPPQSILSTSSLIRSPPERPQELMQTERLAVPEPQSRSEARPSSRRALTRALELAREAVQLDSLNNNPEAAVQAYGRSVALLSEVMERVRRGEDSTESHRRRRRRSIAAQEEEIRRLQTIHDTYADRMNILSLIYSIPAVPYSTSSFYSVSTTSNGTDSAASTSPTTSASPVSETAEQVPHPFYPNHGLHDEYAHNPQHDSDQMALEDSMALLLDSTGMGSISGLPPQSYHPYALQYEPPPQPAPPPGPSNQSQHGRASIRRSRVSANLPPALPHPTVSPPPTPVPLVVEPSQSTSTQGPKRLEVPNTRPRGDSIGHRRTGSGSGRLTALEEEVERFDESQPEDYHVNGDNRGYPPNSMVPDTPRNVRPSSPPLPPLPSPPIPQATYQQHSSPIKPPPSPRLPGAPSLRTRGSSQSTTRSDSTGHSPVINPTPAHGLISQRRVAKGSAPPTPRSSSPAESTASIGSIPLKMPSTSLPGNPPTGTAPVGRSRSSSQPGRRPTFVGGRISPLDQQANRPPIPGTNGTTRKASFPSKLNPQQPFSLSIQTDLSTSLIPPPPALANTLPTTPTSPLPPAPPSDPIRKPYHMMQLLRVTMESPTGGYITRRLHVPRGVWSQGGAKLNNVAEKVRVVGILCAALEDLEKSSAEYFGAGNVSSGLALGIGSIGRTEGSAWLNKVDEFLGACDGVATDFGKKLGVGEGFAKKTTWGQLTRRLDKITNGKNLDSPDAYVQGLRRLFHLAQLLEEHTTAVFSYPPAPAYAALPPDVRVAAETKLKRSSEFFANVVLQFVIQDLGMLLAKYAKKCEKWLEE